MAGNNDSIVSCLFRFIRILLLYTFDVQIRHAAGKVTRPFQWEAERLYVLHASPLLDSQCLPKLSIHIQSCFLGCTFNAE